MGSILEVIEYTDPYCTWCWGSEPIIRKIQEVYGEQVRISYIMGGLVADINHFYDPTNQIGGANWYRQVANHWLDASRRHGMPVDEQIFFDLNDEFRSTYPACIAYKAAQFQDETRANHFLRRMREGAAAERKVIHHRDVQQELAKEVGLNVEQFTDDIEGGKAEEAFVNDLHECRSRGITGFPTFLIRNRKGSESILFGYHRFDDFVSVFQTLAESTLKPHHNRPNDRTILNFVAKYRKVTPKEVAEVFDLPVGSALEQLDTLTEQKFITRQKAGNGLFYLQSLE